jgi:hypothetical protein
LITLRTIIVAFIIYPLIFADYIFNQYFLDWMYYGYRFYDKFTMEETSQYFAFPGILLITMLILSPLIIVIFSKSTEIGFDKEGIVE